MSVVSAVRVRGRTSTSQLDAAGWSVAVRRGVVGAVRVSTTHRHVLADVLDDDGMPWSTQALLGSGGWARIDAPASPPAVTLRAGRLQRLPELPGSGDAVLAPGDLLLVLSGAALDHLAERERSWTDGLTAADPRADGFDVVRTIDRLLGRDCPGSALLALRRAPVLHLHP